MTKGDLARQGRRAVASGMAFALAAAAFAAAGQRGTAGAFTPDAPENHGLSAAALGRLADEMDRLVREGHLVGAELLVLKDRRVVLHRTAGWADREKGVRLERNTIFSLRSMTRPLVGLAAQVLIDEGRLSPGDKVSRFVPAYGRGPTSDITVEHLLTQRSGLPKTTPPEAVSAADLQELVQASLPAKLAFDPGREFQASEAGGDLLAAVLEQASGLGLDDLIQRRLVEPLGLKDTFAFTDGRDERAGRICSSYVGTTGNWNRNWSPADGPPYAFARGSQSFYSTPLDYARLLSLLLDGGRAAGKAVLSAAALRRVLTPASSIPSDTGFSGVTLHYGQMMQLLVSDGDAGGGPVAFGHSSQEGSLAWAWPGADLIVLFFAQTRGVRAEMRIEDAVDRALIHPERSSEVPEALRPFLGRYIDTYGPSGFEEISIIYLNGRLAIDIPSQAVFLLDPADSQGWHSLARNPAIRISFVRNARGEVTTLRRRQGDQTLDIPRAGTAEAERLRQKIRKEREGWEKYQGLYRTEPPVQNVEIVSRQGSLGILRRDQSAPLLLRPPDPQGRWRLKANPAAYVTFEENERGEVVSFTLHTADGQALVRTRAGRSEKRPAPGP